MLGVVRTRVGYAGGTTVDPTYHEIGDHSETLQLDYDPSATSYERLLEVFWQSHDPTQRAWSRQYMAAVFPHNDVQERLAVETRDRLPAARQSRISTQVVPASRFYQAEAYHQKYYLRQAPELMRVFEAVYPHTEDLIASTAAARVNGYLSGAGTAHALAMDIDGLGLTGPAAETLRRIVRRGH